MDLVEGRPEIVGQGVAAGDGVLAGPDLDGAAAAWVRIGSVAGCAVGLLPEDVGVPDVPGVLPDDVHVDPAQ